jgi:hypothetical protein
MSYAGINTFTFERYVLDEADLKAIVLNYLREENGGKRTSIVANEYRLGNTAVRADLAVLGNEFIGVEIKSERDSLKRLPTQVAAYSRYFDRVIVAVSDRHLANLDWKGLREAEVWKISESGRVSVASQRSKLPELYCLSDLMTSAQRARYGLDRSVSADVAALAFETEFRRRFGDTSEKFWSSVGSGKVSASHVGLLSRFRDRRESWSQWSKEQEAQWSDWNIMANSLLEKAT